MKIFYYTWHENSERDIYETLVKLGFDVIKGDIPFKDYEDDLEFTSNLEQAFTEYNCDVFFSFDFFSLIAKTAEKLKKRYIAWIYDSPHNALYSPSVLSEWVSVVVFDKVQYQIMHGIKGKHVYHMPLAVNTERLNKLLGIQMETIDYKYDVSFVGSLYEKNLYRQISYLPEYLKGYIQGLIAAQKKIFGYNLLGELFTGDIYAEMCKYVQMNLDESYLIDNRQLYLDMLNAEVTHQERSDLIKAVAENFEMTLFTASKSDVLPQHIFAGIVSYDEEMPQVFRNSKINLNITLRSIESGIPLRALDIMGAGGFLLTNYQPEIAEYFVDGEEVVMFVSKKDMMNKIAYYLEHEEERKRIAYNGWLKVQREFTYEKQVTKIFELNEM